GHRPWYVWGAGRMVAAVRPRPITRRVRLVGRHHRNRRGTCLDPRRVLLVAHPGPLGRTAEGGRNECLDNRARDSVFSVQQRTFLFLCVFRASVVILSTTETRKTQRDPIPIYREVRDEFPRSGQTPDHH